MKDWYKSTRQCIDAYNTIINKIKNSPEVTNEEDDEFIQNFHIHLAHALIKDTGYGQLAREELKKAAFIIIAAVE